MRVTFFLKEAMRTLRRNATPSLAATLTVLLTALVLGFFIPVVQATNGAADDVRNRVVLDIYVKDGADQAAINKLRTALEGTPNVQSVEFISKEEALKQERERDAQAFDVLGKNPLPDLFRVTPTDPDLITELGDQLAPPTPAKGKGASAQPASPLAAVSDVQTREEETSKILSGTNLVNILAFGLGGLLTMASVALISNTIRLSIFARRREVEVMRLVGATNWFIRWPFVIEGMFVGLAGSALAVAILGLIKVTIIDSLRQSFDILQVPQTMSFPALALILLFGSVLVAGVGSGITLTLSRSLRI
ncbi:MAG: cell division transport system permease protein [Thermoleophilaceae bacterium]|jgi:cell division transport system permease protein|nr:cell division transport system permease protein [Thermoleophilaceae bacterium]